MCVSESSTLPARSPPDLKHVYLHAKASGSAQYTLQLTLAHLERLPCSMFHKSTEQLDIVTILFAMLAALETACKQELAGAKP